jgi:hypothetical protein
LEGEIKNFILGNQGLDVLRNQVHMQLNLSNLQPRIKVKQVNIYMEGINK